MGKHGRKHKEISRLRADTGQHQRIMIVMAVLGILAFVPVVAQLYRLMVVEYDFYAAKALYWKQTARRKRAAAATSITAVCPLPPSPLFSRWSLR